MTLPRFTDMVCGCRSAKQIRSYSMPHWQNTEVQCDGEHGVTVIRAQESHKFTIRDPLSKSKREGMCLSKLRYKLPVVP